MLHDSSELDNVVLEHLLNFFAKRLAHHRNFYFSFVLHFFGAFLSSFKIFDLELFDDILMHLGNCQHRELLGVEILNLLDVRAQVVYQNFPINEHLGSHFQNFRDVSRNIFNLQLVI